MTRSRRARIRLVSLAAVLMLSSTGCQFGWLGGIAGTDCKFYVLEPAESGRLVTVYIPGILEYACVTPM